VEKGNEELVKLLLDKRALVDQARSDGMTSLMLAAHLSNINLVRLLLKCKANVHSALLETGQMALELCLEAGASGDMVDLLLKVSILFIVFLNLSLCCLFIDILYLCRKQYFHLYSLVVIFLNKFLCCWFIDMLYLFVHKAIFFICISFVFKYNLVSQAGAADTPRIDNGTTPLMVAVSQGREEEVEKMLQKGFVANAKNRAGWTPLHFAVERAR
jgi:ankyrin repeat protein